MKSKPFDETANVSDEGIDEQSMDSFPCSDPPSFTATSTIGPPHRGLDHLAPRAHGRRWKRARYAAQGIVFVAGGLLLAAVVLSLIPSSRARHATFRRLRPTSFLS